MANSTVSLELINLTGQRKVIPNLPLSTTVSELKKMAQHLFNMPVKLFYGSDTKGFGHLENNPNDVLIGRYLTSGKKTLHVVFDNSRNINAINENLRVKLNNLRKNVTKSNKGVEYLGGKRKTRRTTRRNRKTLRRR